MIMGLIVLWGVLYALSEAWKNGSSAARAAGGRAATATAGRARTAGAAARQRVATSRHPAAGVARGVGTVCGHAGRGVAAAGRATGRGLRSAWRPVARGARDGWVCGRKRGIRQAARRRVAARRRHRERTNPRPWRTAPRGAAPGPTAATGPHAPEARPDPIRVDAEVIRDPAPAPPERTPIETVDPPAPDSATGAAPPSSPPGWTPQPRPYAIPTGGDGPAASHDPNRPEPIDSTPTDSTPTIEGEIVTLAIGSGESTTYEQTCINAARFGEAASMHIDSVTAEIANAQALAAASRQLADDIRGEDMDAAGEADATADAAQGYAEWLQQGLSLLDTFAGNNDALKAKLATHQGVADQVRALGGGAANRTDYYAA